MSRRALGVAALAALASMACENPPVRRSLQRRFADLGRLEAAVLHSRGEAEARELSVHGDRRVGVSIDTPARIAFRSEPLASPELRFALAVRPPEADLTLAVEVNGKRVLEESWAGERGWVERNFDLSTFSGEPLRIELDFAGGDATVLLAHPQLLGEPKDSRPNVIVYVVDCLRADHVGAYGYPLETTPSIDRLAADSLLFEDLSSCSSWTKPSTGCLFTSSLPTVHQARTVDDALPRSRVTLAEVFRDAGYVTAAWVANPVIDPRLFSFNQGFDRWVDVRTFEERSRRSHLHDMNPDAADITNAVLPWLEAHRGERFFLYLHSLDLHFPYQARPPFDSRFVSEESAGLDRDRESYDAELAYNDREIGRLVDRLKELGLYDDTALLLTGDHGEEFGEHGASRHGKTLYQPVLHIPGVLKLARSRLAGVRSPLLASNIDMAPTLLDIADIEAPHAFQGRSLLPLVEKGDSEKDRRVAAELVAPNVLAYAIRGERFKHIRTLVPSQDEMLFDLDADPEEGKNLLPSVPAEAEALIADLERFVRLGQQGAHFAVRGKTPGAAIQVEIETGARIESAYRFSMVTGDVMEIAPERDRLSLRFVADGKARHLVVQTDPPGADLNVLVSGDGKVLSRSALKMEDLAVPVDEAERLLHESEEPLRVWYLAPRGEPVVLDDEMRDILRSLGYIQ